MNISSCKVMKKFPDGKEEEKDILLVREHNLLIKVNGNKWASLVCSESDLLELTAGHLLSSGLIECKDDIKDIRFCQTKKEAFVLLKDETTFVPVEKKEKSCCPENYDFLQSQDVAPLRKVKSAFYKDEWIFSLAKTFSKDSLLHSHTSGTHSCMLSKEGQVIFAAEDIGRHCALDKVLGYMLLNDFEPSQMCVFTSGRVPVDMVEKVIRAGVGVLVSKSVPTAESAALSKEYGLALIFRAWEDSFELV